MSDADEWKHSPWPESPEAPGGPEDASWAYPELEDQDGRVLLTVALWSIAFEIAVALLIFWTITSIF